MPAVVRLPASRLECIRAVLEESIKTHGAERRRLRGVAILLQADAALFHTVAHADEVSRANALNDVMDALLPA